VPERPPKCAGIGARVLRNGRPSHAGTGAQVRPENAPKSETRDDFPMPIEDLLASMFEVLKQKGAAREIAILTQADVLGQQTDYDNLDGGIYIYGLQLALDLTLYGRLEAAERASAEKIIAEVARPFFHHRPQVAFDSVRIVPKPVANERWREDAAEFLTGKGINNQGRVRSDNIASLQHEGLLFRSRPEINLYVAFKALGVTFAPLPVFIRGGQTYARLEPDFVLLKNGVPMVVEVDGDTYHHETPAQAHQRLVPLDHEGARIERVNADECKTPEAARKCADRLLQILNKRISQGGR